MSRGPPFISVVRVRAALLEDGRRWRPPRRARGATGAPPAPVPITQTSARSWRIAHRRRGPRVAVVAQGGRGAQGLERDDARAEREQRGADAEAVDRGRARPSSARRPRRRRSRATGGSGGSGAQTISTSRAKRAPLTPGHARIASSWWPASSSIAAVAAPASAVAIASRDRDVIGASPSVGHDRREGLEVLEVELADRVEDQREDEVAGGVDHRGHEGEVDRLGVVGGRERGRQLLERARLLVGAALCGQPAASRSSSRRASNSGPVKAVAA